MSTYQPMLKLYERNWVILAYRLTDYDIDLSGLSYTGDVFTEIRDFPYTPKITISGLTGGECILTPGDIRPATIMVHIYTSLTLLDIRTATGTFRSFRFDDTENRVTYPPWLKHLIDRVRGKRYHFTRKYINRLPL